MDLSLIKKKKIVERDCRFGFDNVQIERGFGLGRDPYPSANRGRVGVISIRRLDITLQNVYYIFYLYLNIFKLILKIFYILFYIGMNIRLLCRQNIL